VIEQARLRFGACPSHHYNVTLLQRPLVEKGSIRAGTGIDFTRRNPIDLKICGPQTIDPEGRLLTGRT
jgi:hypothetical protein